MSGNKIAIQEGLDGQSSIRLDVLIDSVEPVWLESMGRRFQVTEVPLNTTIQAVRVDGDGRPLTS